jgi:hypothetical protein
MIQHGGAEFDPAFYLANAGPGRRIVHLEAKQNLFSQGDPADSIFYLQSGQAKITVVSKAGKDRHGPRRRRLCRRRVTDSNARPAIGNGYSHNSVQHTQN